MTIENIVNIRTEEEFASVALELFRYQAERCAPYREYIALLGIEPTEVKRVEDIPFLPIEIFKSHDVYCGEGEPEIIFTSSNTGGTVASRHMMQSLATYRVAFTHAFEEFYGATEKWSIYGLLPNYLEREGSSLVYMVDELIRKAGSGGFYLNDYERLIADIEADQLRNTQSAVQKQRQNAEIALTMGTIHRLQQGKGVLQRQIAGERAHLLRRIHIFTGIFVQNMHFIAQIIEKRAN